MNVLLIDNFDSFTYNLSQYLSELADGVTVVRNDEVPFERIRAGDFSHIVISPGPGNPTDPAYFGGAKQVIEEFHQRIPLLGICLGHQGIGAALGGTIVKAPTIMHGKTSTFRHSGLGLFKDVPENITVMRYHSLVVDKNTMPSELVVDAVAEDGSIMAFHHASLPIFGMQFHPESFATETGKQLLQNFLQTKRLPDNSSSGPKSSSLGHNPPWARQRNKSYASSPRTNSDSKLDNFGLEENHQASSKGAAS